MLTPITGLHLMKTTLRGQGMRIFHMVMKLLFPQLASIQEMIRPDKFGHYCGIFGGYFAPVCLYEGFVDIGFDFCVAECLGAWEAVLFGGVG